MSINQLDDHSMSQRPLQLQQQQPYMSQYRYAQPDDALQDEMRKVGKIWCCFHGCNAILPLLRIKEHERKECPRMCVSCRYQPFGCPWKGWRGDLSPHEEKDYALAKVSGLVDQCRLMQAQLDLVARKQGTRVLALGHALEFQHEQMCRHTLRICTNVMDVLSFVVMVL